MNGIEQAVQALQAVGGLVGLVMAVGGAFAWAGARREREKAQAELAKLAADAQDVRIKRIEDALQNHNAMALAVGQLETKMDGLKEQLAQQPALLGMVVGAALKEAFRYLRETQAAATAAHPRTA